MCIYCGTDKYRKIYENHHGSIPIDDENRTYEIHHIDNNHYNNDPNNLIALSIYEHYEIHYWQEDWYAAGKIASKMKLSTNELAELARKHARSLVDAKTHHFCRTGEENHNYDSTLHKFENVVTGEIVEMTQNDFLIKYQIKNQGNLSSLISQTRSVCENWKIFGTQTTSEFIKHKFQNIKTEEIEVLTQDEFVKKFNANRGHTCQMIKRNPKIKTVKSWKIII